MTIVQNRRIANIKAACAGILKSVDMECVFAMKVIIQLKQINANHVSQHLDFINVYVGFFGIPYITLLFFIVTKPITN